MAALPLFVQGSALARIAGLFLLLQSSSWLRPGCTRPPWPRKATDIDPSKLSLIPVMQDALFFSGSDEFEACLQQHHATSDGVWIRMAKKHMGFASLDWASAVEVVLCFGWIDGQSRRVDEDWFVQRFTP